MNENNRIIVEACAVIVLALFGALGVYRESRINENLRIHRHVLQTDFDRRVRHDLEVLQHFGVFCLGLHERDARKIRDGIAAINVKLAQQRKPLEKHLGRESYRVPREPGEVTVPLTSRRVSQ